MTPAKRHRPQSSKRVRIRAERRPLGRRIGLLVLALGILGVFGLVTFHFDWRETEWYRSLEPFRLWGTGRHSPQARFESPPTQDSDPQEVPKKPIRLALVLDDLGRDLAELERIERLPRPIAIAVLPGERRSREVATRAQAAGLELLCHLPMEPEGSENPGPGALKVGLSAEELERRTLLFLQEVPGARGVNNHMGSRFTRDEAGMRVVLRVLAQNDLFFLDSWTHPGSVGPRLAGELGVPFRVRDVFLDDDQAPSAVAAQFRRWLDIARRRGTAVAIGHPHPTTLEVLERELPRALRQGYELVALSNILEMNRTIAR